METQILVRNNDDRPIERLAPKNRINIWSSKNILITGGEGMIGRELRELLRAMNAHVHIADLKNGIDLRIPDVCIELCKNKDYVFHLAGVKGNPRMTKEQPASFMGPMLQFDTNMIIAAQIAGVPNFLYTSSIAVENPQTDMYPAWAKMTAEKLIESMRIQFPNGTKYCVVRPANVYGRFDNFKNPNAMVITSLINAAMEKNKIEIYGDGKQERDFINAYDVAVGMLKCIIDMDKKPRNLCSGETVTIEQVARLIQKEWPKVDIDYIPAGDRVMGDNRRVMNINWNFEPSIDIATGIKEVCRWLKNGNRQ